MRSTIGNGLVLTVVYLVGILPISAANGSPNIQEALEYPQLIIYNAKIAVMDDAGFGPNIGAVAQAMAVRDGKVLLTGGNTAVRAIAGPHTKLIDLKGRTVLPGFIMTHEHPTDWAFQEPRAITHVLPKDDILIHRWLTGNPKEQLAKFEPVVTDAVAKAKPGQPILISFNYGVNWEWSKEMQELFAKSITKEWLDALAPDNPLKVKNGMLISVINQKAIERLQRVYPSMSIITDSTESTMPPLDQWLKRGTGFNRQVEPDVMLEGKLPILAEILKAEFELWASWGITTFASSPYTFENFHALHYLDDRGDLPARFAWAYTGPGWDIDTLRYLAGIQGTGSDYLWFIGAVGKTGSNCMSIPPRAEWIAEHGREAAAREGNCALGPNSKYRERMANVIKAHLRFATLTNGWGDKDIDYLMDIIEQASRDAGMSLDEIRAMRHTFDQGVLRPDQISRMRNLGMITTQANSYLWEDIAADRLKMYGPEYANWVVPRKSMAEAGVIATADIDLPKPEKVFYFISKGISRIRDDDGTVYGSKEKADRFIQLKAHTRWGAYYLLRENELGTLEKGKLADFMVLDQDYLTIPEDQIAKIKVLMTVVGGKVVHLASSLAKEIGIQPMGATTWQERIPAGW